ncbi:cationic amino acid transporter 4-like isoform X2 [Mercenaria mercenaria]|nr:cationic amino acid transporter 4-like isoform X2 [Mercenaria mercenaria]XP_045162358.1 cationic amino acid transporter 4-like isoform X2 [Mercenaria mercenaria]XP_053379124.1 cationic amino acid transporter 4-like isoform X2 [Mercenaria mercenaria]
MAAKVKDRVGTFWSSVNRKKTITEDFHDTPLKKCLSTFDMTLLGVGQMVGAGIYVLTGTIVKDLAGPAAILSYLFAGIAAILSALCYAEFGARVPKAGSAYSYTYIAIGEIWAFVIGWNVVLEHLLGAASVARAWSGAIDALFNGEIRKSTLENVGYLSHGSPWISDYPDFIAMSITILIFAVIASGAKFTVHFNTVFTVFNCVVILFLVCAGFAFADERNWTEHGGFFPYGFGGALAGAATCFYAYIGFEGIAVSSEEAREPEKSIPIATITSLLVVSVIYILATTALTLIVPYYKVDPAAAFPAAFATRGITWAKYIVGIGTLFGITTSLLGSAFSLPRAVYAMAQDGLLFKSLAYVHPKFQTPVLAIVIFGSISALMALLFEITTLVEFMSIGTLTAYTIVSASVIVLRYLPVYKCQFKLKPEEEQQMPDDTSPTEESSIIRKSKSQDDFGKLKHKLRAFPILNQFEAGNAVMIATFLLFVSIVCTNALLIFGYDYISQGSWWAILLLIVFVAMVVTCYLAMVAHEKNDAFLTFQIPLVPLIPALSIACNTALMMKLGYLTWIRLGIWMAVGFLVYFAYGMRNSIEGKPITYGPMITYGGEADMSTGTLSRLDEEVVQQQPDVKEDTKTYGT